MKIKICKADNEIVGKIIEKDGKELDFSNLKMIDVLYRNNEDVELEFDGLSEIEKSKINGLFDKISKKINDAKTLKNEELKTE